MRRDMGEGGGGSCFRRETWPCEVEASPGGLMKGLWWRHSCQYNSRQTFWQMRCARAIANGQMDGWTGSSCRSSSRVAGEINSQVPGRELLRRGNKETRVGKMMDVKEQGRSQISQSQTKSLGYAARLQIYF